MSANAALPFSRNSHESSSSPLPGCGLEDEAVPDAVTGTLVSAAVVAIDVVAAAIVGGGVGTFAGSVVAVGRVGATGVADVEGVIGAVVAMITSVVVSASADVTALDSDLSPVEHAPNRPSVTRANPAHLSRWRHGKGRPLPGGPSSVG